VLGRQIDVNRSDFFQIHTDNQNFLRHENVKSGGLICPISSSTDFANHSSPYLMRPQTDTDTTWQTEGQQVIAHWQNAPFDIYLPSLFASAGR
jgi:hypothetical protein